MVLPRKRRHVWMGSEPCTYVKTHMWSHTSATVELLVGRDGRSQLSGKPIWPIDETVDEREDGDLGWEPGDGDEVAQKNHTLICPLTW